MNKLIAKCKGKYIAQLESDDVWTTDKIEKQVAFLETHPEFVVCGGNALCIDEKNKILSSRKQNRQPCTIYNLEDMVSFTYQIFPLTVIARKEIYDVVGKFDQSLLYINAFTWLKITSNNYPIVILPDIVGYYRIHANNVHWNSYSMYESLIKTVDQFKDQPFYGRAFKNAMSHIFPYLAIHNKMEALRILPKAFKINFKIFKGLLVLMIPFSVLKFFTGIRYK